MADSYSLKAILSAVDGISPVLKSMQGVAKNARKYLGDVGTSAGRLGSQLGVPLGVISAIGAGFGLMAIKKAVVDFADLGEEVEKGALKAGMGVEQYQRMKYVFDQAGVSAEVMQMSMGKLNKNLGAAASGKGNDLVLLFKTFNIPLRGVNGQIRNAAELLPSLARAFTKNKDPVRQAAMGTALFGKAYQEMLPLLNDGSEGIEESILRLAKLKGVISPEDVHGAREFGKQLKDVAMVTKGFQMTIAKELVPVLGPLIENFIQWAAANKKLIGTEVKSMVQGVVKAVKQLDWVAFIEGVKSTAASIGRFVDSIGGAKNALIALFVVMNIQSIAAVFGLIGSLGRLALALFSVGDAALVAMGQLAAFAAAQATIGGALTTSLAGVAKSAGLVAAAGLIGYAIGTGIYNLLLADNRVGDWIGEKLAQVLAFFGNEDAKAALASNAKLALSMVGKTPAIEPAAAIAAGKTPAIEPAAAIAAGPPLRANSAQPTPLWASNSKLARSMAGNNPAIESAAAIARSPLPPATPGALGSGSFNINAPATANLNGKVDIDFKNAPPGMVVTQAKSDGPRVAMNTNVGYRTLGTEGAF